MIKMSSKERREVFILTVLCFIIGAIVPLVWKGVISGSVAIVLIAFGFLGVVILAIHRDPALPEDRMIPSLRGIWMGLPEDMPLILKPVFLPLIWLYIIFRREER